MNKRQRVLVVLICGCLSLWGSAKFTNQVNVRAVKTKSSATRVSELDHRAATNPKVEDSFPSLACNFTSAGGNWTVVGTVQDNEGGSEHILEWSPTQTSCHGKRKYRRFDQTAALECLAGKNLLFYGNSNTRTLFIALEALLRGSKMTSRVAAKQRCDNSKANHSCWAVVNDGRQPVHIHYVSYTGDLFHEKQLNERLQQLSVVEQRSVDIVVGNSGLNVIQLQDDEVFLKAHHQNVPKLQRFIDSFARTGRDTTFVWHTTTPVCPNQPHFRRYRYNAKHWRYRSLERINAAIALSNTIALEALWGATYVPKVKLVVLDDWKMLTARRDADAFDLCPFFEDPLHHRFLDREIVQVFLNEVCV